MISQFFKKGGWSKLIQYLGSTVKRKSILTKPLLVKIIELI